MVDNRESTEDVRKPQDVLNTWFRDSETGRMDLPQAKRWFMGGKDFDDTLNVKYRNTLDAATKGDLDQWLEKSDTTLALIILLDQISRNVYRGTSHAFSNDTKALSAANHAIAQNYAEQLPFTQRVFCHMPFMHDESMESQDICVTLFEQLKRDAPEEHAEFSDRTLSSAIEHREIIMQFGRYPHRNAVLNRTDTAEETVWLETRKKSFGQ